MSNRSATAVAHPNIALIKYWGNRDNEWNIPSSGSLSMTLGEVFTTTKITLDEERDRDFLSINGLIASEMAQQRLSAFMDGVRKLSGRRGYCVVESQNNFPQGVGIASSASAFAALALAASALFELPLDVIAVSRLARLGSGSACRSILGGFVEWLAGEDHLSSYAIQIAPPDHWDLVDCIAVVSREHKGVVSKEGHRLASTSPLQSCRIATANERLEVCRQAIQKRDFDALTRVVELDSNLMHAVMMTSTPMLFYWQPATLNILLEVPRKRLEGLPLCYTIDAGPNVHILTLKDHASDVRAWLKEIPGVQEVLFAPMGGDAKLVKVE